MPTINLNGTPVTYEPVSQTLRIGDAVSAKEVGYFQAAAVLFALVEFTGDMADARVVSVMPASRNHFVDVESSQIKMVGFDWSAQILTIIFHGRVKKDGSVTPPVAYRYFDVPGATVGAILFAPSVGSAFDVLVKRGGFRFEKVVE